MNAWRVKNEDGEDLIAVWKRRAIGSDEYAAAEIIEQLEARLAAAEKRGDFWRKQAEEWDQRAADEQAERESREAVLEECKDAIRGCRDQNEYDNYDRAIASIDALAEKPT